MRTRGRSFSSSRLSFHALVVRRLLAGSWQSCRFLFQRVRVSAVATEQPASRAAAIGTLLWQFPPASFAVVDSSACASRPFEPLIALSSLAAPESSKSFGSASRSLLKQDLFFFESVYFVASSMCLQSLLCIVECFLAAASSALAAFSSAD